MTKHLKDERVVAEAAGAAQVANAGVPTQVANPRRTSWRTFLQSVIGGLVALNAALALTAAFLLANEPAAAAVLGEWYGPVVAIVSAAAAAGALLAKWLAQLMANPLVNAWIEKNAPWLAPIRAEDPVLIHPDAR